MSAMTTMTMSITGSHEGTSLRLDAMSFLIALSLHAPLYFMKFDTHKKAVERSTNRLVSIDLIEEEALKPPAPLPVDVPTPLKTNSLMDKLKMLVHKEPPPPPPPKPVEKVVPDKLDMGPKEIKLEANLKLPEKLNPALQSKSGFKPTADAKLIEEKQISLKNTGAALAPLSEKKYGAVADRSSLSDKGSFKLAKGESLQSIGGGPSMKVDAGAPVIALPTGKTGSSEKFSAPPPQMANKGKFAGAGIPSLGTDQKLGLRDSIIARDAAPSQIATGNSRGGSTGGVPGGVEGGLGVKKDAGRFQGGTPITGAGSGAIARAQTDIKPIVAPVAKPVQKKSMFVITGDLKDRKILQQQNPDYPAEMQAKGIEAAVILQFTVNPDGMVKESSLVVRRTSGYDSLDQSAMKALKKWKFAPIETGENREEVGTITFNFSLS